MKKLIPAYVISFVMSFMLFIFEPITMYANNINDFWFDLYIMLKPVMLMFSSSFCFLSLILTIIYLINKKLSKRLTFYNICVAITFGIFISLYIQGNFLANNLPPLNGSFINWNDYKLDYIISIVLMAIILVGLIISTVKFKLEKVVKSTTFISLAVLTMLLSSFITTLLTPNLFNKKAFTVSTTDNYNLVSEKNNFFILMLDAVDSVMFDEVMSNDEDFKNMFDDFTYYKDTVGAYPCTRDSVPFILSGMWNENKERFRDYYNKALDNSLLLEKLSENSYNINIYDNDLLWESEKSKNVANLKNLNRIINSKDYIKNQMKYILFKYLPYPLKKYSRIEGLNFYSSKVAGNLDLFNWKDVSNYNHIKKDTYNKTNEKVFKFIHIEGAHAPFDLNKDVELVKKGTYKQKIEASLTITKAYLDKLKKNNIYDNSSIIIIADHGYAPSLDHVGRQNPILLIKGVGEHHKINKSSKAISFEDLNNAYIDLLNNKKSDELFKNIGEQRERKYIWYEYNKENHMVEYIQTGKAWDEDTLKPTGKEFNL